MNILVKGSIEKEDEFVGTKGTKEEYSQLRSRFEAACRAIGYALAGRKHTIMLGVPHWENLTDRNVVAGYVLEGANQLEQKRARHQVFFYAPKTPEPPDTTRGIIDTLEDFREKYTHLQIEDSFLGKGPWSASMIPDVQKADAVILISGGEGTATIGYSAFSMDKPIITITGFGGAALDLWDNLMSNLYDKYIDSNVITASEVRLLHYPWNSEVKTDGVQAAQEDLAKLAKGNRDAAQGIVELAEKYSRAYQQDTKESRRVTRLTIWYSIVFVLLWVAVFLGRLYLGFEVALFLLLFVSAVIGTGLRMMASIQDNSTGPVTAQRMLIDLGIAIVIAFGLSLIYMIGGISFTGKVVMVVQSGETNTFQTIAISMSLLGLAAGYLQPLRALSERLQGYISPQNKPQV